MSKRLSKRLKKKGLTAAVKQGAVALSEADAKSQGGLACARGQSRDSAPDLKPLARTAWLEGYDAESTRRAHAQLTPLQRAAGHARFSELLDRLKNLPEAG